LVMRVVLLVARMIFCFLAGWLEPIGSLLMRLLVAFATARGSKWVLCFKISCRADLHGVEDQLHVKIPLCTVLFSFKQPDTSSRIGLTFCFFLCNSHQNMEVPHSSNTPTRNPAADLVEGRRTKLSRHGSTTQ